MLDVEFGEGQPDIQLEGRRIDVGRKRPTPALELLRDDAVEIPGVPAQSDQADENDTEGTAPEDLPEPPLLTQINTSGAGSRRL